MTLTAAVLIGGSGYCSRWRGGRDRGTWGRLLWRWHVCKLNKHHKGPAEAVYSITVSTGMHVNFKRIIPTVLYRVGFPIFPPVSSADCSISMSITTTTRLEESSNKPKGNYMRQTNRQKGAGGRKCEWKHKPAIWQCVDGCLLQHTHTVRYQEVLFVQIVQLCGQQESYIHKKQIYLSLVPNYLLRYNFCLEILLYFVIHRGG